MENLVQRSTPDMTVYIVGEKGLLAWMFIAAFLKMQKTDNN